MLAVFFCLSWVQFAGSKRRMVWCFVACFVMGLLVELAEGFTGVHHCRMRDLIPDMTGTLIAAAMIQLGRYVASMRSSSARHELRDDRFHGGET